MAGMDWFRWHHGSVTDPKFQLIAKKTNSNAAEVIAVWACLLEHCSQNRARMSGFEPGACDELLGLEKGATQRICVALEQRGFLVADQIAFPRLYFPASGMRPSGGVWAFIRAWVFKRDNYTCQYCGAHGVKLECDHVVPVADGGLHTEANLVTACFSCNRSKGSRPLNEWEVSRGW